MPEKKNKVPYLVGALAAALGITAVVVLIAKFGRGSSTDGENVPATSKERTSHTTTTENSHMVPKKPNEPSNSGTASNKPHSPMSKVNKQVQPEAPENLKAEIKPATKPTNEKEVPIGKVNKQSQPEALKIGQPEIKAVANLEKTEKNLKEINSTDDNKDLPKPPRKRITKDPTKPVEPTAQAKNTASQWLTDNKAKLDPLFKDSMTSDKIIQSIQAANSFNDVANIIFDEIKANGKDFLYGDPTLPRALSSLFLQVLADYFDRLDEDATVVEALLHLADDVGPRKMSNYEYAANWGTVVMKVKNLDALTSLYDTKEKKGSMCAMSFFSYIPYDFFVRGDMNLLRDPTYQTSTTHLLSARSAKEALEKVRELDLDMPNSEIIHNYFQAITLLFRFTNKTIFSIICPYFYGSDVKAILQHMKDIVNRNVVKPPPGICPHQFKEKYFLKVSQDIAKILKSENESDEELKKWAEFSAAYEKLNHGEGSS